MLHHTLERLTGINTKRHGKVFPSKTLLCEQRHQQILSGKQSKDKTKNSNFPGICNNANQTTLCIVLKQLIGNLFFIFFQV